MRRLAGDYIFLRQPGDGDYARWLIDLLPRVVVAAQFCDLSAFRFVVARSTSQRMQVVRDSLGLFGVRPERIVAIGDAPTFFQRLVFPLPAAKYPCGKSPRAIEALEYLPARFPDASDAPRRLYVKTGEDEALLDLLKPSGFVAVEPERMSFAERARAFGKAEWIAGAAGAGLANAALAPRGLRLLAVTARGDEEAFYRDLAEVKQGRFFSLRPDADSAAVTALFDDFLA
nr:glycosyltransferase 61 family protein [Candidatus Rhodoblastus alkanivorans]